MPDYYCIYLCKDPEELDPQDIIKHTVGCLLEAGCTYKFSTHQVIGYDPLDKFWHQKIVRKDTVTEIEEAICFTVQDIKSWISREKRRWNSPRITHMFSYDFLFDRKTRAKIPEKRLKEACQVRLNFWVTRDTLLKRDIVEIDIDTYEDGVLKYGNKKTHEYNKQQILNIIESVAKKVCPHLGWSDYESWAGGHAYGLIENGEMISAYEYVVVGPQLISNVPTSSIENTEHFVKRLDNGVVILHGRIQK